MATTIFEFNKKKIIMNGYSPNDWIFTTIKNRKTFYEVDLLKYMRFALRRSDGYILDIGANIGNHSVFFGLIMAKKVICFEPNPPIFKILEKNLVQNNITYQAYNIGLGDTTSLYDIDITHTNAENNIGAAKLYRSPSGEIIVEKLDKLIDDFKYKDENMIAIKADIEGMEPHMLRGAIITLNRYKPDLFLEIDSKEKMREIEDILYPLGYEKLYMYAGTPVWHFSHSSKLSPMRKTELWIYDSLIKIKQLIAQSMRFVRAY